MPTVDGRMNLDTFTEVTPRLCPDAQLKKKKTKLELKQEDRQRKRKFTEHTNRKMVENATINMLSSGESLSQYHRKRMATSFEKENSYGPQPPKKKKHSPAESSFTWDTAAVLHDLQNFPEYEIINWSKFAWEHAVPGKNGGQTVKEFARENGIDTH